MKKSIYLVAGTTFICITSLISYRILLISGGRPEQAPLIITDRVVSFCSIDRVRSSRTIAEGVILPTEDIDCIDRGKAFFVSSDGLLITPAHLIHSGALAYEVRTSSGDIYHPRLLSLLSSHDIALLRLEQARTQHYTLGNPGTLADTITLIRSGSTLTGKILALDSTIEASLGILGKTNTLSGLIQIDIPVESGESGSPVLDMSGAVIGMIIARHLEGSGGYMVRFGLR